MYTNEYVKDQLILTIEGINRQMDAVNEFAARHGCPPHQVMDTAGRHMLSDLLVAKAQALHGLALLETN